MKVTVTLLRTGMKLIIDTDEVDYHGFNEDEQGNHVHLICLNGREMFIEEDYEEIKERASQSS